MLESSSDGGSDRDGRVTPGQDPEDDPRARYHVFGRGLPGVTAPMAIGLVVLLAVLVAGLVLAIMNPPSSSTATAPTTSFSISALGLGSLPTTTLPEATPCAWRPGPPSGGAPWPPAFTCAEISATAAGDQVTATGH